MTCKMCLQNREWLEQYNCHPRCGFESGVFDATATNEWNCQTLIALRDLAEGSGAHYIDSNENRIFVLPFEVDLAGEEITRSGWLVMGCYKRRGHTEFALVIYPEGVVSEAARVEPLNLDLAEAILQQYGIVAKGVEANV